MLIVFSDNTEINFYNCSIGKTRKQIKKYCNIFGVSAKIIINDIVIYNHGNKSA